MSTSLYSGSAYDFIFIDERLCPTCPTYIGIIIKFSKFKNKIIIERHLGHVGHHYNFIKVRRELT